MGVLKKILLYTLIWTALGIFSYFYFVNRDIPGNYKNMEEAKKQLQSIVNEVNELAKERKKLEEEVIALKQNSEKQEEKARKEGLSRPGERIIRFLEKP